MRPASAIPIPVRIKDAGSGTPDGPAGPPVNSASLRNTHNAKKVFPRHDQGITCPETGEIDESLGIVVAKPVTEKILALIVTNSGSCVFA
jgi:hypothetical protein